MSQQSSFAHSALQPPASSPADDAEMLSHIATRNLEVSYSLRATARSLAEAGLRTFRLELSEEQVQAEVRAMFRRASG